MDNLAFLEGQKNEALDIGDGQLLQKETQDKFKKEQVH